MPQLPPSSPLFLVLLAALPFALSAPAWADPTTVMVLNVAVDITGVTGDDGNFTVACHVSQHGAVKDNFLDGHTQMALVHDNVKGTYVGGTYVGHFQGPVRVEMNQQFVAPKYDFAKLDTYFCEIDMTADGPATPTITGPLPKTGGAALPLANARDMIVKRGLLAPAKP